MDAPERIWMGPDGYWVSREKSGHHWAEYVRAALYTALKVERDKLFNALADQVRSSGVWQAENARLAAENERLRAYARETDCPRPCNGRPDDFTAVQCVEAGECGCGALAALTGDSDA